MKHNRMLGLVLLLFLALALPVSAGFFDGLISAHTFDRVTISNSNIDNHDINYNVSGMTSTNLVLNLSGIQGYSFQVNGSNAIGVYDEYESYFNQTDEVSISFWHYSIGVGDAAYNTNALIGSSLSNNFTQALHLWWDDSTNKYTIYAGKAASACATNLEGTAINPPQSGWRHLVLIANETKITLYVNGTQDISHNFDYGDPINCYDKDVGLFGLFKTLTYDAGYGRSLNQVIDEVYVWNRSITQTEINDLYTHFYELENIQLNSPNVDANPKNLTVNFDCNMTGTNYINLSLVVDGEVKYTVFNTTVNENMTINTEILLAEGAHNWTCEARNMSNYLLDTFVRDFTIIPFTFDICNASNNVPYLNFTFEDENNGTSLTADFDIIVGYFWDNDISTLSSLTYTNLTQNKAYPFCFNYPDKEITVNFTSIKYKSTVPAYPQRSMIYNAILDNLTTNQTLYMLHADDGTYTTFQVLNAANQVVYNVSVSVVTGGDTVASGFTDNAGIITFFLDPDVIYTLTFIHPSYAEYTTSIAPTQSSFTVILGETLSLNQSYAQGISWTISPWFDVLVNNTNYNFQFNLTSSYWLLDSFGFYLTNSSGSIIGSNSSTIANGGSVSLYNNTGNHSRIYINFYWIINGSNNNLTFSWFVRDTSQGDYSLMTFFDDLKTFSGNGWDDDTVTFNLLFISVSLLILIIILVVFNTNITSPLPVLGLITLLIFGFEYVGLIPAIYNIKYFMSILSAVILFGYFLKEKGGS